MDSPKTIEPPLIYHWRVERLAPATRRLDRFLVFAFAQDAPNTTMSRNHLQQLIKQGAVVVNQAPATDPNQSLKLHDAVTITIPPPKELAITPKKIPLNILYEDDAILVLDKPAGLTVHPSIGHFHHSLVHGLLYHCGQNLSGINGVLRPGIVHRLDKDTSGVMVIAKNDKSHHVLSDYFNRRTIQRHYIALVWGDVAIPKTANLEGIINKPLGRNPNQRLQMAVVKEEKGGRPAETRYRVIKQKYGVSLITCRLMTGRTHQIRAHFTHLKHPLVGDMVYGGKSRQPTKDTPEKIAHQLMGFPRQCLHAYELGFLHPISQKPLHFITSPPQDMAILFNDLGLTDAIENITKG